MHDLDSAVILLTCLWTHFRCRGKLPLRLFLLAQSLQDRAQEVVGALVLGVKFDGAPQKTLPTGHKQCAGKIFGIRQSRAASGLK